MFAASLPDLSPGGVGPVDDFANVHSPGVVVPRWGEAIKLIATVSNNSASTAQRFRADVYLSSDATITPSDFRLGTVSFNGSGSSNTGYLVTWMPGSAPRGLSNTGPIHFGLIVDPGDQVRESNEANNAQVAAPRIDVRSRVGLADLRVTHFLPSGHDIAWGRPVEFAFDLINQGVGHAGQFRVGFYAQQGAGTPVLLGRSSFDFLAAGNRIAPFLGDTGVEPFKFRTRLPDQPFAGFDASRPVTFFAVADAFNQITESNETNNRDTRQGMGQWTTPVAPRGTSFLNDNTIGSATNLGTVGASPLVGRDRVINGVEFDLYRVRIGQTANVSIDLGSTVGLSIRLFDGAAREIAASTSGSLSRRLTSGGYVVGISKTGATAYNPLTGQPAAGGEHRGWQPSVYAVRVTRA